MKKYLSIILIAAMVVFCFAGCGNDNSNNDNSSNSSSNDNSSNSSSNDNSSNDNSSNDNNDSSNNDNDNNNDNDSNNIDNNGGTADSKVNGKNYAFESYTVDGEDQTAMMTSIYKEQSFTFKDGGVCVQTMVWADEMAEMMGGTDPVEMEGTYEESGDTVKVTFADGEEGDFTMEFKIDGDTLKMEEDGGVTVYKVKG